jgi:Phage ABA sandwich domain
MELKDWELDQFIATQIMKEHGTPPYASNISECWKVVEKMMQTFHVELRLDVFLGLTGQRWVASFYSPIQCRRYEAQAGSAPLAICRAAREAFLSRGN